MLKVMMSKVTINLKMFSPFMKGKLVYNMNNTLVVTIYKSETRKGNTHIYQVTSITKLYLIGGRCHRTILSFCGRSRNDRLLLDLQTNKRINIIICT